MPPSMKPRPGYVTVMEPYFDFLMTGFKYIQCRNPYLLLSVHRLDDR